MTDVQFQVGVGTFSPHHYNQTSSETHPASYPMCNGASFIRAEAARVWSWPLTSI